MVYELLFRETATRIAHAASSLLPWNDSVRCSNLSRLIFSPYNTAMHVMRLATRPPEYYSPYFVSSRKWE